MTRSLLVVAALALVALGGYVVGSTKASRTRVRAAAVAPSLQSGAAESYRPSLRVPFPVSDEGGGKTAAPRWIFVDHEPGFARTSPYDLKGLGPVLALRHRLAERQWDSLTKRTGGDPILYRFEIVDAQSSVSPLDFARQVPASYQGSFDVSALLYWATLAPGDGAMPLASYLHRDSSGVRHEGPGVDRVRLQWVVYTLTAGGTTPRSGDGLRVLTLGAKGWTIEGPPRVLAESELRGPAAEKALASYDLSICEVTG